MKILELVCYKPRKFDDHGHIIDLEVGQICISERELKAKCHRQISRIEIQRSIIKLKLVGFLRQEVSHKKNILTITHKETYELLIKSNEPRNEPNLSQTRAKLEPETNKEKKEKKEKDSSLKVSNETKNKVSIFSDQVLEIGKSLIEIMRSKKEDLKISELQMIKFHNSIDHMLKKNEKSPETILKVFTSAIEDKFWCPLMFSSNPAASLSKHFNQLEMRMNIKPEQKERKFAPCSDDAKSLEKMNEWAKGAL